MREWSFLAVVIVFAVISAFVLYLDVSEGCGSLKCVSIYLSGEDVPEIKDLPASEYYTLKEVNSAKDFFDNAVSVVITPFVGPSESDFLLQPTGDPDPPIAPSNLVATALSHQVIGLTWTDNSLDEDGFRIERSPAGEISFVTVGTVGVDITSFDNTGLNPSTGYNYRVVAFNGAGDSGYSNEYQATTFASTPSISSLNPNSFNSGVDTEITVAGSNFGPVFGIVIRAEGQTEWNPWCTVGDGNCFYDNQNQIRFWVRASNSAPGNYEISYINAYGPLTSGPAPFSILSPGATIISPSGLQVTTQTSNSITLSWTDNSGNEDGFRIERSLDGITNWALAGSVGVDIRTFIDDNGGNGLSSGTTYYYRVYTYNSLSNSGFSNTASGTTLYSVTISPNSIQTSLNPETITLIRNGGTLPFSQNYGIEIRDYANPPNIVAECIIHSILNPTGIGPFGVCDPYNPSNPNQITFRIRPSPSVTPQGYPFQIRYGNLDDLANVIYSDFVNLAVFDFSVGVSSTSGSVEQGGSIAVVVTANHIGAGTPTPVTFSVEPTSLPTDVTATFSPTSCTPQIEVPCTSTMTLDAGTSAQIVSGQTISIIGTRTSPSGSVARSTSYSLSVTSGTPIAPTNLIVSNLPQPDGRTKLNLAWSQTSTNENGFKIERSTDGVNFGEIDTVGENVVSYQDSGLSSYVRYYYQVRAYRGSFNSAYTNIDNKVTLASPPVSPILSYSELTANSVRLNWNSQPISTGTAYTYSISRRVGTGSFAPVAGATNLPSGTSTYLVSGLSSSTAYEFKTTVSNGILPDSESNIVGFTTPSLACSTYSQANCGTAPEGCVYITTGCNAQNQYNGFTNICILSSTQLNYACIANQCTVNPLGQAQVYGASCIPEYQVPSVSSISVNSNPLTPTTTAWSNPFILTINGNNFASASSVIVLIDDVSFTPTTGTITSTINQITVPIGARELNSGNHGVKVMNPGTAQTAPLTFTLTVNPVITSITAASTGTNLIYNTVANVVDVAGRDFDPQAQVMANIPSMGIISLRDLLGVQDIINSGLIRLNLPVLFPLAGDVLLHIVAGDGTQSTPPQLLRLYYPFDYIISLNPSNMQVVSRYTFNTEVRLDSYPFMNYEEVLLTADTSLAPGATATFTPDICKPTETHCTANLNVIVGSIAANENQIITVIGTSQGTRRVVRQADLTLIGTIGNINLCSNNILDTSNGETDIDCGGPTCSACSIGLSCLVSRDCVASYSGGPGLCYNLICSFDDDGDGVPNGPAPNNIDLCANTPSGTIVSTLNGCPYPTASSFTSSMTTGFSAVPDLNAVENMTVGLQGAGNILYSENVNVLRLVGSGTSAYHIALDLDDAITLENNLISVNSIDYSELNKPAFLTFDNLPVTYTSAPVTTIIDGPTSTICSSTICTPLSFNSNLRNFVVRVTGFSNYSTQTSTCGDSYCNALSETCSSCPNDCGTCPSSPGPSGGGGGGGGGGGPPRVPAQCSDRIDNDGDGKIDYPADLGCSNATDRTELDTNPLIGYLNNTPEDNLGDDSEAAGSEEDKAFEVRIVFWIVLIALIGGIIAAGVIIMRSMNRHKKFEALAKIAVHPLEGAGKGQPRPPVGI